MTPLSYARIPQTVGTVTVAVGAEAVTVTVVVAVTESVDGTVMVWLRVVANVTVAVEAM
jgi:hypothetical protein